MASTPPANRSPRPTSPWRPTRLQIWGVYRRERRPRARAEDSSNRRRSTTVSYDVRFHVDGHQFSVGFDKKGWADAFADKLQAHFADGCLFDPAARRFIPPDDPQHQGPTFFHFVREYVQRKWPTWQPSSRRNNQRDLARAVLHLLDPAAPHLEGDKLIEADDFLRRVALILPAPDELSAADREWKSFFTRWSLPLRSINDGHLQDFLERVRTTATDGSARLIAPTTLDATRRAVRAAFRSAQKRRLIDWNPWDGVDWKLPTGEDDLRVELVMDPEQVLTLAEACAQTHPRYACFVLVQGFCGLRPGEARDVRRRDFDLHSTPATVTVGGQHSDLPERFFMQGESRRRPLKGRGQRVSRPVPIPAVLVPRFAEHLKRWVERKPAALAFTTPRGQRINISNFHRDVWAPARERVFPEGSPLREVRRHDLRHSAITAWLNSGVLLKTAQRWSGHRTASVLLDTYLGVMRDDTATSLSRVEAVLETTLADTEVSRAGRGAHGNEQDKEADGGNER
jgi:integrase